MFGRVHLGCGLSILSSTTLNQDDAPPPMQRNNGWEDRPLKGLRPFLAPWRVNDAFFSRLILMKSILTRLSAYKYHHVVIRKCKWWGIELIKSRGRRSNDASILMQHWCGHCALSPCSIGTQGAFFSENFYQETSRSEAEMSGNLFAWLSWLLRPPNWAREVRVHYLSKGNIIVNYLSGQETL